MSNRIFAVLRRVRANIHNSLNPAALELFRDRGVITYAEAQEYKSYWRKRTTITDAQKKQKVAINQRVLDYHDRETAALIAKARALGLKV